MQQRFDQNWYRIEHEIATACQELAPELPGWESLGSDDRAELGEDLLKVTLEVLYHFTKFQEGAASTIRPPIQGALRVFGDTIYEFGVRQAGGSA